MGSCPNYNPARASEAAPWVAGDTIRNSRVPGTPVVNRGGLPLGSWFLPSQDPAQLLFERRQKRLLFQWSAGLLRKGIMRREGGSSLDSWLSGQSNEAIATDHDDAGSRAPLPSSDGPASLPLGTCRRGTSDRRSPTRHQRHSVCSRRSAAKVRTARSLAGRPGRRPVAELSTTPWRS